MTTMVETVPSADGTLIAFERIGGGAPVNLIGGAYNDRSPFSWPTARRAPPA
jgi:hypothetical protein